MEVYKETVFEHLIGQRFYGISTDEMKVRNKLNKLKEQYPDECVCIAENEDGSVFYHVPESWVCIRPPKKMNLSDEKRAELAERMKNMRGVKNDG